MIMLSNIISFLSHVCTCTHTQILSLLRTRVRTHTHKHSFCLSLNISLPFLPFIPSSLPLWRHSFLPPFLSLSLSLSFTRTCARVRSISLMYKTRVLTLYLSHAHSGSKRAHRNSKILTLKRSRRQFDWYLEYFRKFYMHIRGERLLHTLDRGVIPLFNTGAWPRTSDNQIRLLNQLRGEPYDLSYGFNAWEYVGSLLRIFWSGVNL